MMVCYARIQAVRLSMIIGAAEEFINRETNRMKQTKPNENKKQNETNQTFRRGRTHAMHNISNVFSILII